MKKIIIFAKKMESGGTEVSLINTIKELEKYETEITLALLKKEGIYLKEIPKNVKVVEILNKNQNKYFEKLNFKNTHLLLMIKIILMKILMKINLEKAYDILLNNIKKIDKNYDIAIDFHGYGYFGTAYVIKKIKASRKITFIHDENIDWMKNIENTISKYDKIYCVSTSCKDVVKKEYPELEKKLEVFRNIIDKDKVIKLSNEKIEDLSDKINLLTIGRLEYQKGYDLLIKIAKKLDKSKYRWYIIGTGSLYNEISKSIINNSLQENIILLGMKINPYPYIKSADIYVQPSRHEGYGIAIAEARCLNKPIIATDLECIKEQLINNYTGILCKFNVDDFWEKINDLMLDEEKRKFYSNNLKNDGFKDNNDIIKILEE